MVDIHVAAKLAHAQVQEERGRNAMVDHEAAARRRAVRRRAGGQAVRRLALGARLSFAAGNSSRHSLRGEEGVAPAEVELSRRGVGGEQRV